MFHLSHYSLLFFIPKIIHVLKFVLILSFYWIWLFFFSFHPLFLFICFEFMLFFRSLWVYFMQFWPSIEIDHVCYFLFWSLRIYFMQFWLSIEIDYVCYFFYFGPYSFDFCFVFKYYNFFGPKVLIDFNFCYFNWN